MIAQEVKLSQSIFDSNFREIEDALKGIGITFQVKNFDAIFKKIFKGTKNAEYSAKSFAEFCSIVESGISNGFSHLIATRYDTDNRGFLDNKKPYQFRMRKGEKTFVIYYNLNDCQYTDFISDTQKYKLIP